VACYPPPPKSNNYIWKKMSTWSTCKQLTVLSTLPSRYSLHGAHSNGLTQSTRRLGFSEKWS
jgi:hypothetical protein